MKIRLGIFCILQFFELVVFAQKEFKPVVLLGHINVDTGTVQLLSVGNPDYYPDHTLTWAKATVEHGQFIFQGKGLYPCAYLLFLISAGNYISGRFFVDTGRQDIYFNIASSREVPDTSNSVTEEYKRDFLSKLDSVSSSYDYGAIRDHHVGLFLVRYTKRHPNSYIVLWELAEQLRWHYSEALDTAYAYLSSHVSHSFTGIKLKKHILIQKKLSVGHTFISMKVSNAAGHKSILRVGGSGSKFTLVDFWFSHCGPCLGEFKEYRRIYAARKSAGLEIIGISTDGEKQIPDWKRVIKDSSLIWPQYLDMGGVQSRNFDIDLFPTNFLLDQRGKIVAKNLSPEEVWKFVRENQNNKSKCSFPKDVRK